MDIISLGAATKAGMEENKTRKQTLELGVNGAHASVAKRLEMLETSYLSGVKKANELIVKDTINIMKAHARLNAIALSKKYRMESMIFDDLLDLSGIDIEKSVGYVHDPISGVINSRGEDYIVQTKGEIFNNNISQLIFIIQASIVPSSMPALSSNIDKGYIVKSSSEVEGYEAYKAFDQSVESSEISYWSKRNFVAGDFISLIYPSPTVINRYELHTANVSNLYVQAPKSWSLKGWDEQNSKWDILDIRTGEVAKSHGWRAYDFVNNKPYKEYKLEVSENNGSNSLSLGELKFSRAGVFKTEDFLENSLKEVSFDLGVNWIKIEENKVNEIRMNELSVSGSIILRLKLKSDVQLLNYALTWA